MKTLKLNVKRSDSYLAIKERKKTAEVRLLRGCINKIKKDDIIYLIHNGESLKIHVNKIDIYESIEKMLNNKTAKNASGGFRNNLDLNFYTQFYKPDEITNHKVAVIYLRLESDFLINY